MQAIKHVISADTMAELKAKKGVQNMVALLIGSQSPADGKGGFYRWQTGEQAESLTYMDVIRVTGDSTGYWKRMYLNASVLPHGVLISSGGVKTFFSTANYITNAAGQSSIFLTMENTAGGTPIFSEIWWNSSRVLPPAEIPANINDIGDGVCASQAVNLKTTTHIFKRGNTITLGSTLLAIVGLVFNSYRYVPTGTKVQFKIQGV